MGTGKGAAVFSDPLPTLVSALWVLEACVPADELENQEVLVRNAKSGRRKTGETWSHVGGGMREGEVRI